MYVVRLDAVITDAVDTLRSMIERLSNEDGKILMVFQEKKLLVALMERKPPNRMKAKVEPYRNGLQSDLVFYYQLLPRSFVNMLKLVSQLKSIQWTAYF